MRHPLTGTLSCKRNGLMTRNTAMPAAPGSWFGSGARPVHHVNPDRCTEPGHDMAFRLPPLSSLRVFEAAARHNSFRKAADELNLTASAVSHGVQTLENWLGVELFRRETRGLRLTSAGETYAPFVNQALNILAGATERVPG